LESFLGQYFLSHPLRIYFSFSPALPRFNRSSAPFSPRRPVSVGPVVALSAFRFGPSGGQDRPYRLTAQFSPLDGFQRSILKYGLSS